MLAYLAALRRFNRNVRLLYVASAAIGFTVYGGIYSVLLNLFLLRLGYGPEFIGAVNGLGLLGFAVWAVPSAIVGRRVGYARMLRLGLSSTAICYGLLPVAVFLPEAWRSPWLLASFAAGSPGIASFFVNIHPIMMGSIRPDQRNLAYAVMGSLWPLAGFAGALIAGLLPGLFAALLGVTLEAPEPFAFPLMLAAVTLAVAAVVLLGIREINPQVAVERGTGKVPLAYGFFLITALVVMLRGSGEATTRTFVNVYLDDSLHITTAQIGALLSVGQLLTGAAVLLMPAISRRFGNVRTSFAFSVGVGIGLLPIAFAPHWWAVAIGFTAVLTCASIAGSSFGVYILASQPNAHRAVISGFSNAGWAISQSLTAFGGGYVIAAFGYQTLFLGASAIAVTAAVLIWAGFVREGGRWRSA